MIRDGKAYVSNSLLKTAAECSTKLVLSYILNYTTPEEHGAMLAGKAIHEALAVWFKGGTLKESLRALRLAYKEWAEEHIDTEDRYQARLGWENVRKVTKYWMQSHPMTAWPFTVKPEHVEVPFQVPLSKDGAIIFRGVLDAGPVTDNQSGNLFVLDHKSTGQISPGWLKSFRMSSQLTGYLWALEQTHPTLTVVGAYVNAIQLSKLPGLDNPTYKCRDPEHGGVTYEECQHLHITSEFVITQRTSEQVKEWKQTALGLARKYLEWGGKDRGFEDQFKTNKVPQEGLFTGACTYCEFHDFCHTGRKNWKMLVQKPPEEERK